MKPNKTIKFKLLREFEELEDLFDLLNQMVVKGNKVSVSVKSKNSFKYIKIYAYTDSKIPSLGIKRDLYVMPSDEVLSYLDQIDFDKVFLKFSVKEKDIIMEIFSKPYEYIPNEKSNHFMNLSGHTDFEELFNLSFRIKNSFENINDLLYIINQMLSNKYSSFLKIESSQNNSKKQLALNFFVGDLTKPSLFFNATIIGNQNGANMTKYNMFCSSRDYPIRIFFDLEKEDFMGPIIKATAFVWKTSGDYNKIIEQCKLLDYATKP